MPTFENTGNNCVGFYSTHMVFRVISSLLTTVSELLNPKAK